LLVMMMLPLAVDSTLSMLQGPKLVRTAYHGRFSDVVLILRADVLLHFGTHFGSRHCCRY
jgi:hypothetical protein